MRRIRLKGDRHQPDLAAGHQQSAEAGLEAALTALGQDLHDGVAGEIAHAADQVAAAWAGWHTLTGVTVDTERGSLAAWCGSDEPLTLGLDARQYDAADQVAAVAKLSAAGVPVRVHAHRGRVTLTTSSAEFGMHSVTGTPRLP